MKVLLMSGLSLALLSSATSAADPPAPLSRADLDKRINESLRQTIDIGATIYNAGNREGCYRLYEGALTVTIPLLDHRPELQRSAAEKLLRARKMDFTDDAAFLLREAIDDIRLGVRGLSRPPKPVAPKESLWVRLGGEAGVNRIVKDWLKSAVADPKVNFTRGGKYPIDEKKLADLEKKFAALVSDYAEGPLKYGGNPDIGFVHKGMAITADEFDALIKDLMATMTKLNVDPLAAKELVAAISISRRFIVEVKPAPGAAPAETGKSPTLWSRLGGEPAVKAVVKEFVTLAAADPKVNFLRDGKYQLDDKGRAELEQKLVDFVSTNTGGPQAYKGRDMKSAHKGMGITEAEFNAAADDLKAALKKLNVPQKETDDLMSVVAATKKDIVEK